MLSTLKPQLVWQIFSDICQIPHPSHHEEKISQYIMDFAEKNKIEAKKDAVGNILLQKKAHPDKAHYPSIALQAHMDMVPQKNETTLHNFLTDPIEVYVDGAWVKAKGTTLGADNGIGLSSALAVLVDPSIKHGPLEVLITTSEETGMYGAFGLQPNWLKSHFLINTDSEQEGELFTGCAGGVDFCASIPIHYGPNRHIDNSYVELSLKGLKGGHSGCDIHLGRGNAIKLLVRFFAEYASDWPYQLVKIEGGTLRNAIPREAFATITLPTEYLNQLQEAIKKYQDTLSNELATSDPNLQLALVELEKPNSIMVMEDESKIKLINWLHSAPNGVIRMSDDLQGVVETSLNFGVLTIKANSANANFLIRSQVDSAKHALLSTLKSHSQLIGALYQISGEYSGWKPVLSSPFLKLAENKYNEIFAKKPKITVIHAGLECGIFKKAYPFLDMISIGPTIVSPHSPDEKVNIQSVEDYWKWLIGILQSADLLDTYKNMDS